MTAVYSLHIGSREQNHSCLGTHSSSRIKVVAKKSKVAPSSCIRNPYKRRINNFPLCSSTSAQKTKAQKVVTPSPKCSSRLFQNRFMYHDESHIHHSVPLNIQHK